MKAVQLITLLGVVVVSVVAWSRIEKHGSEHPYTVAQGDIHHEAVVATHPPEVRRPPASLTEPTRDNPASSKAEELPAETGSSPTTQIVEPKRPLAAREDRASVKKNSAPAFHPATAMSPQKEPPQDPVAREALYLVGADPAAEEYWWDAINDPGLSGQERQDLIEDLNEDGLSDPHHPTMDDLPLIMNRIALLEEVGQDAMDQVNADAFQEAYKDLLNLARTASGGAAP